MPLYLIHIPAAWPAALKTLIHLAYVFAPKVRTAPPLGQHVLRRMLTFNWEEFYLLGPGSQKEYEKLKKSNPSYLDTFILEKISEQYDEYDGLIVEVIRVTDKKRFQIPLSDLKSTNKRSKNYKLLDDYSVWIVNF